MNKRSPSHIVIIQPGSSFLKIGLANQGQPFVVPQVVARRLRYKDQANRTADASSPRVKNSVGGNDTSQKRQLQLRILRYEIERENMLADLPKRSLAQVTTTVEEGGKRKEPSCFNELLRKCAQGVKIEASDRYPSYTGIWYDEKNCDVPLDSGKQDQNSGTKAHKRQRRSKPRLDFGLTINGPESANGPTVEAEEDIQESWTDVTDKPECIAGTTALLLPPSEQENYAMRYPMQDGYFQKPGAHGISAIPPEYSSKEEILNDLHEILLAALQEELALSKPELASYDCVLLVPDPFIKQDVSDMLTILLDHLGFRSCMVQQEATCSTFGAGLPLACVVNIGDQCTSISCVEEGIVLPGTSVYLPYGGADVSALLLQLFRTSVFHYFPYPQCDLNIMQDRIMINKLKEKECHCRRNIDTSARGDGIVPDSFVRVLKLKKRGNHKDNEKSLIMNAGEELVLAPMAFFQPSCFDLSDSSRRYAWVAQSADLWSSHGIGLTDYEDCYDGGVLAAASAVASKGKQLTKAKPATIAAAEAAAMLQAAGAPPGATAAAAAVDGVDSERREITDSYMPGGIPQAHAVVGDTVRLAIDQAVILSITRTRPDLQRKLYANVLLSGGSVGFRGLQTVLKARLMVKSHLPKHPYSVKVVLSSKAPPQMLSWKGAATMCTLESAQDLWFSRTEWQSSGVQVLRERLPFVW